MYIFTNISPKPNGHTGAVVESTEIRHTHERREKKKQFN